jgi:hypothetical protein
MFGISISVVSKIISELLPHLHKFFSNYFPEKKISDSPSSIMNFRVNFIVDGTTTPILRRYPQRKYW